ncbi:hypothetical protein U6W15_12170 [Cutibacterium acnes]
MHHNWRGACVAVKRIAQPKRINKIIFKKKKKYNKTEKKKKIIKTHTQKTRLILSKGKISYTRLKNGIQVPYLAQL